MIALAQPPATAGDSWEAFAEVLAQEAAVLARLGVAAQHLTAILVDGTPSAILEADRRLNTIRLEHHSTSAKRRGMQARGFGGLTLRQVCEYAPRHLAGPLNQHLSDLTIGSISLGITLRNNKSLITAGLDRLVKITGKLQETVSEHTGVYKRRGFVAPPGASVIVSSQV